jgi:stage II sporulation SpoAA-like protein
MIYRLIDLPSSVIGFKALWHLTEKDFEEVLIPSVQDHVGKTGKLNCLIILNNSVKHFRISALSGLKRLMHWKANWRRVAIVSESRTAKIFINLLSTLFTGEFRVFSLDELDQAIEWAAQETTPT